MPTYRFTSITDQVVETLRDGMLSGRWRDYLPGRDRLARELGVSHRTVESAMRRLAEMGMLASRGAGQRRRIVLPDKDQLPQDFRVQILINESADQSSPIITGMLGQLSNASFTARISTKTLTGLGMDVGRISKYVEKTSADAWIIAAGSREVLEWFSRQSIPSFALFGIKAGLPMAGVGIRKDIKPVIRRLVSLGHQRIVLILREDHLMPKPSVFAQSYLDALESEGITPGRYHLPSWGYKPEKLHHRLDSLFEYTPPTALMVEELHIFVAVRDYLAQKGIVAPKDLSLICLEQDISHDWCNPRVTHFVNDIAPVIQRTLRWTKNVARGMRDIRQTFCMAEFVEGGTIGPAPKE